MKKIIFILLLLPASVLLSRAQSDDVWQQFKDKFPDEPAVFVERSEVLNILPDGDSLKVYLDVTEDILHLKEQSDIFSGKRVYGSHFNQVANLKAKTLVWDKNRYKEMVVSDFKKNSDRSAGIFYDDSYYYSFDFPSIASRNRTQLQYRENLKDVRFVPGYVFASYLPQGKSSYVIKTTKDVELSYEVLHDDKKQIQFRKTEKGNSVTYEWSAQYMPALKGEENSPSIRYFVPHVVCYVKSYKTKKGQVKVLSNLDDLYSWYYTFVEKLNKDNSPELSAIVEKIKANSKSEIETVKKVFYWVQDNIQYIAFEQGMRGLIPHNGSYVCEKRYGDCKDMANLIVNMLQIAGIKAYHTWIGTRDLPYRYTEVPTPLVDNHMIATYISKDGQYYFLDGTSDHTTFGYPSSMIQGKEALIGIDPAHYEVKEVPVIAKEKNIMTDTMKIKLDANQLVGTGVSTLSGYPKVFAGYELDRSEKDDVKRYVTKLVGKGSNKFFLDKYTLQFMEERDKPTRVEYDFRISDYFQKLGDELYINLNLNKDYYNDFINVASRKAPRDIEYKYIKYEVIDMTMPDGYTVEYMPPNAKYDGPLLGCDVSYESLPGKIRCSKKFYVDYIMLQPEQFTAWNDAVKQISEMYKESIILKKK
ncbi:MAG TPA: transglutaminase domain-containing protein [Ohtaekwangia sp.]|uniref:transglutaminase-like domain-containing protein n=1 Tax=Ohtaekwangia sp. TaxID=2066019 RepID=UPI002F93F785